MSDPDKTRPAAGEGPLDRLARRFQPTRVLILLILLGAAWRLVRYGLAFPFWGDESFVAINFITRDFAGMIRPLDWGQIVPLGVMWAELAVARVLGLSEWSLRLLPTLAGLASLGLFAMFAPRVLPKRAAVLAIGIFAASYYVVRHGAEVKPYIIDCLVSLVLLMLAWGVQRRLERPAGWIVLALAAAAAVWCSYPAVFVCGSVGLLLLVRVQKARWAAPSVAGLFVFGVAFLASFAAMYLVYAKPHAAAAARLTEIRMWTQAFPPPFTQPLELLTWLVGIHTDLMLAYPVGGTTPGSAGTLILVIVGAVWLIRRGKGGLVWLLLGPLTLTFIAAALRAYPYGSSARTSLYMAPAFCLLAAYGLWMLLQLLPHRLRRHGFNGCVIVLAAIPVAGMIQDIRKPYATADTRVIRATLRGYAAQTGPGDLWITFNAAEPKAYAPWLGDWRGTGGQYVFDLARFSPVALDWAPEPERVEAPGGRVWLFVYRGVKIAFPQEQFDAYLERLQARLGSPDWHEQTRLKERDGNIEAIDVWRFDPPAEAP